MPIITWKRCGKQHTCHPSANDEYARDCDYCDCTEKPCCGSLEHERLKNNKLICTSTKTPETAKLKNTRKLFKNGAFIEITDQSNQGHSHKTIPLKKKES